MRKMYSEAQLSVIVDDALDKSSIGQELDVVAENVESLQSTVGALGTTVSGNTSSINDLTSALATTDSNVAALSTKVDNIPTIDSDYVTLWNDHINIKITSSDSPSMFGHFEFDVLIFANSTATGPSLQFNDYATFMQYLKGWGGYLTASGFLNNGTQSMYVCSVRAYSKDVMRLNMIPTSDGSEVSWDIPAGTNVNFTERVKQVVSRTAGE